MSQAPIDEAVEHLHLFTSTIRELYIADALDVLAAPVGAHYRFRYEGKYIEDKTKKEWQSKKLNGLSVVVYFSIQHPADFHPAVFIPLRRGEVVDTAVEGETHAVYFRLGDYLPLADNPDWKEQKDRANPVRKFTEGLHQLLGDNHPDNRIHATLGASSDKLISPTGNAGRDFETIVRYLTPSLYFSPRVYYRITEIIRDDNGKPVPLDREGNVILTAGASYTVKIAHYQYQPLLADTRIGVTRPTGVEIIGDSEVSFSSRYDLIPVRLFPKFRDDVISGELSFKTCEPSLGPTVRLPVIISPSVAHTISGPAFAVGGACALALPAVFISDKNLLLRFLLVLFGSLAVGLAIWWRRAKGLTG
jgi:hypothetical protein